MTSISMDASVIASVCETQKRLRDDDAGLGKDYISKLPDDILHHILSFLPTDDLVRTSALSTRWKRVWTFFPVIDIDLDWVNEVVRELRTGFLDLVEREMLIPSNARIRKFRLNLKVTKVDGSDVMLWVDKVVEHKVLELDLHLPVQTFYRLPDRLFSSNLLATLKLVMNGELMVPNSVCFPSLKTLHLSLLRFSSVRSTQNLFSRCPVLEELALNNCNWDRINGIVIYFPSLRTLSIDHDTFPLNNLPASKIKISAPSLLSLKCRARSPMNLVLCNLAALEDASIDVSDLIFFDRASSFPVAVKLLDAVQGAKSLTLSSHTLETLSFVTGTDLYASLPTFHSLKHLHVDCDFHVYTPRAFIEVLRKTANLHSLSMDEVFRSAALNGKNGALNIVPDCFKTSLKRFELMRFNGGVKEVWFLELLLENAALLENMSIHCLNILCEDFDGYHEIRKELELSRRGATNCVIEFFDL